MKILVHNGLPKMMALILELSSSGRANRRSTDEYGKILREVEVNPKTSTC
jgi:hypothetical protein